MIANRIWLASAAVLLSAVVAIADEVVVPSPTSNDATIDVAGAGQGTSPSSPLAPNAPSVVIDPNVDATPVDCGPGCATSFSFSSWTRFGSCCPTQPCELAWFPIDRVTCQCPPHEYWYGEVSAIGWRRDTDPSGVHLATLDAGGDVVLSSQQAWPDFRAGAVVRLGRMFTPTTAIEYGYLGSGTWSGNAAVADQSPNMPGGLGNLFSPFGDFGAAPVDDFDYNELVSIQGSTQFESFELNLRHRLCMPAEPLQVSIFYGIRYLDVGERFGYYSQTQVPLGVGATQLVDVRAKNDLFGAQIGMLLEWHIEPRWWFDARLSAGLYNNRAGQNTHHVETGDAPGENWLESRGDRGSVGAEVALSLVYYFTPRVSTRVGYHFLWMDHVALAAENFETDPTLLREGPAQLNADGTIMFHGPFLGLALGW
ncbi:MAG TPA: BBP7 family outer membrane beta-barrel protein [Thermoguttaceae bacterium]|nr:BBP7 family outer membrane beta-barrel protein [Thermoguttaceae bacterium]